ncbi:MAG: TOBE domain-containing protein, partial [Candidatus Bathyarchaeia archaeon]
LEEVLSEVPCILRGRVKSVEREDAAVRLTVELEAQPQLKIAFSGEKAERLSLKPGDPVEVSIGVRGLSPL